MENNERSVHPQVPPGFVLAPIHNADDGTPLRICILTRTEPDSIGNSFVLLRELPGSRVYLGAVCDLDARVQEWIEVWVQTLELRDLAFSGYQEKLANLTFDDRWRSEYEMSKTALPHNVVVTGMEAKNPSPVVIKRRSPKATTTAAPSEGTSWRICKDDALLESLGLPPYSTSPFRYLYEPNGTGAKTFLAAAADAPTNSHVQSIDRLKSTADATEVFNPHAGLVRVTRFSPLNFEDYLQLLEGQAWQGAGPGGARLYQRGIYADLQAWSASPKGMPFLLHGAASPAQRLNEVLFLKLSALRDIFKEVRTYVKMQQLPLLNLTPASFTVRLHDAGDQFPALWAAKCSLVKPGQAHPLKIKSTEQRYFIRLGKIEPSPFLPEGLGAHSFGIGTVRLRNVVPEGDGVVLEGTLVAEDYLSLDPHDLLWFKLPLEERLEFYAHVYTAEAVGPREARFRTVPTKLPAATVETLKRSLTSFAKSPYEIWPLLSSPCDLHSLGVIAIRVLLANSKTNLPIVIDDVLSLARHLGKEPAGDDKLLPKLKALVEKEKNLLDLVSPTALVERGWTPEQARSQVHLDQWLEIITLVLRLFPGTGSYSYCKGFGDVSPLALESVFDRPIQELESLVLRLRSALAPSLAANEEIASVLAEELAAS